jgi:hypothetical protein
MPKRHIVQADGAQVVQQALQWVDAQWSSSAA